MTLVELRKQIVRDTITRHEVLQVLQQHLTQPDDPYVERKLRRALVSAEYYFSERADNLMGFEPHLEHARTMLIQDIYVAGFYSRREDNP